MNLKLIAAAAFTLLAASNILTLLAVSELKKEIQAVRVEVINVNDSLGYFPEGGVLKMGPETVSDSVKDIHRKISNLCVKAGCN